MINSQKVKEIAKSLGADLCGIASMDRFEGAPAQMDPRYIFPGARALIMLGYRIPRGTLRGIEEGTFFINYSSMGYAGINLVYGPVVLWHLNRLLEDEGYETVPIPNMNGAEAVSPLTGNFRKGWSMSVDGKKPHPDILIHYRIAAFCAGLGEIGYSRLFLTPEFGPRNRFNLLLTAAPLEPDPIYEGPKLCDRCKLCVKNCGTGALSGTDTQKVRVAGHDLEWAKIDPYACETGIKGGKDGELNPFIGDFPHQYGYGRAIEGAFGCMRACMVHLEEKGVLKKKFSEPFRSEKPWRVDHREEDKIAPIVKEQYIDKGKAEDYSSYITYNKTSNYGNEKGSSSGLGLGKDDE
jgi:ferredoxin